MPSEPGPRDVGVAIPAAGSGERMGGRPKAFLELLGEPVLLRALRPFLEHPAVGSIAVALAAEDAAEPPDWLGGLGPRVTLVEGGASRLHSVHAALAALAAFPAEPEIVVVHDAARPLVTPEIIDRCLRVAREGHGAVAGWPAVDTLKEVDRVGWVRSTPDRSRLWHAQTPQAFPFRDLRAAYERAVEEDVPATDDAALFARYGGRVRIVEGAPWNLKLTRPEDVAVAEVWMASVRSAARESR